MRSFPTRQLASTMMTMVLMAMLAPSAALAQPAPVCLLVGRCGDVNASGKVTASDALAVLREAVGAGPGLTCNCSDDPATEVVFEVDEPMVEIGSSYQLLASFPHIADQGQDWALLSDPAAGALTEDGLYTAGAAPGKDVVEVASLTSPHTRRTQEVRVLASEKLHYHMYNMNGAAVDDGGVAPKFPVSTTITAAYVTTYHYNSGTGTAAPGTLGLKRLEDNKVFGPWPAYGLPGSGLTPNLFWSVNLGGLVLEPGTYEILDSDPSTWSSNAITSGEGMSQVLDWNLF